MAEISSMGVHTPVALGYLIAEGFLPPDPRSDLYKWDNYVFSEPDGDIDQEILSTKQCVVWSVGNYVRNVYRFDLEGEDVEQAVLTTFPYSPSLSLDVSSQRNSSNGTLDSISRPRNGMEPLIDSDLEVISANNPGNQRMSSRALVVLLKTKLHIHFLHGSSHIVDLPFPVERMFAAPRGVLLERRSETFRPVPASPHVPIAPPNSFLSSYLQPSSSYLQSPTLQKSFASAQRSRQSAELNGDQKVKLPYQNLFPASGQSQYEDDLARLYTLSSPFSTFGVVTWSQPLQSLRLSNRNQAGTAMEFEILDPEERLVYISPSDELKTSRNTSNGALTLVVTVNDDLKRLTIWHAWYIEEKSLASLVKARSSAKDGKSFRRSSFPNASIGTGATTPAPRPRDGARESFAAAGSVRLPPERATGRAGRASLKKQTRQEEEAAMASQMDPDYVPTGPQKVTRESRRISSLNAELRGAPNAGATSFAGTGGRRTTSFGGPIERKSLGHRKSRGSTPGSVFSRSLGPDDDLMEVDQSTDMDDEEMEENIDSIVRQIRATMNAAGTDSVFGSVEDDFKRELIVRKLHSLPLPASSKFSGDVASKIRVVTLAETKLLQENDDQRLNIYVHEQPTKDLTSFEILVRQRRLYAEDPESMDLAIPFVIGEMRMDRCTSVVKLRDGGVEAVLFGSNGLLYSNEQAHLSSLPTAAQYRAYGPYDFFARYSTNTKDIGKNRMLPPPAGDITLANSGSRGCFDEVGADGVHHRRRLRLRPAEDSVHRLIEACQVLLPNRLSKEVLPLWRASFDLLRQDPGQAHTAAGSIEWLAVIATIMALAIHMVDAKVISSLNMKMAAARHGQGNSNQTTRQDRNRESPPQPSWPWIHRNHGSQIGQETNSEDDSKNDALLLVTTIADELQRGFLGALYNSKVSKPSHSELVRLMAGLHVFREEQKLSVTSRIVPELDLAAVIAQLGAWLGLREWSYEAGQYYSLEGANETKLCFVKSTRPAPVQNVIMQQPVSVYSWFENALKYHTTEHYLSIADLVASAAHLPLTKERLHDLQMMTPRIVVLSDVVSSTNCFNVSAVEIVELAAQHGVDRKMLETLPSGIAAPVREAIAICGSQPPSTWAKNLLELVARDDLDITSAQASKSRPRLQHAARDLHTICQGLEGPSQESKTREADRHEVSQLIFNEDRRLVEATSLMHSNTVQVAECVRQPDWTEAVHLEQQRRVMGWATIRMIALPAGDAMIHFDSQTPLLTEKYHLPGFNSSCLIQPMGHTLTTDRAGLTEEKVNWAYFNAGVSMGLRISRNVKGIDTSWIAFNKPNELTNRHAGLLLALGLNGHLKSLAKWLAFKYLTPKHMVTSVGLLLGLSASHMGTMDGLITRMLSVHITRMLPPGAAELNVSPLTQTAGLMGIGLLYYNTQHRRMSEIMLSEVENMELEDPDSGPDPLRDEAYRLAAGLALGFINLGKGKDLQGLHGIDLAERLLSIAVGPRAINAVHVFDRATAGAVIAIALVYMKSGDLSIAMKIDIPDTEAQYEHVRPDMLMLRVMAKHLILWDHIQVSGQSDGASGSKQGSTWIQDNMPSCYKRHFETLDATRGRFRLTSVDVPFLNIVTGLAWVLSLKYAGSGNVAARDEILAILSRFTSLSTDAYYYDAKLARSSLRRCVDVLALSAATIMAGTGDLQTFRHLRRLHGRTDAETPYGSHLAAHLAIGALFLGGGTFTFGTSNLATASLICAFYPLFPNDVHDNLVHLQAFRHFWVFAAEARCLVLEDIDTLRPVSIPIIVRMKDGSTKGMDETRPLMTPCLLPDLDTIASVETNDPTYWHVQLDFLGNPSRLDAFRKNQTVHVRRCPASEAHDSSFSATLAARSAERSNSDSTVPSLTTATPSHLFHSLFSLPALKEIDRPMIDLVLPPDTGSWDADHGSTVVDDRLDLSQAVHSNDRDALWNLRVLLAWATRASEAGVKLKWIGEDVVESLRAAVEDRMRSKVSENNMDST